METSQSLCDRLRARGLVVTPQRRTIFEVLEKREDHPSAETVHEEVRRRLPDVSLATVYKTLRELVSMGELQELNFDGTRSRFDPKVHDHGHLWCERCEGVLDVEIDPSKVRQAICRTDILVTRADVVLRGLCPTCQDAARIDPEPPTATGTYGPTR